VPTDRLDVRNPQTRQSAAVASLPAQLTVGDEVVENLLIGRLVDPRPFAPGGFAERQPFPEIRPARKLSSWLSVPSMARDTMNRMSEALSCATVFSSPTITRSVRSWARNNVRASSSSGGAS
jgi:hypothetical protein